MKWFDWLIMILPVVGVLYMGWYTRRYIRGVVDFLSAGRLCGRYIISVASVASGLSIIGIVAFVEVHYRTGYALGFWSSITLPVSVVLGLTGFFTYRFRETKAMSMGQFVEMRYSRKLRIFAASLRSISEMLANMIMPAIAARFFIYFLDLPKELEILGFRISTFSLLIFVGLVLAVSIICMGGMLSIVITDSLQGLILYPLLVMFIIFIMYKFSWFQEIAPVMADRAPGESFLNPYEIKNLRDFNLFFLALMILQMVLNHGIWVTGAASNAKSPHEQKMARLLGNWRSALNYLFYVLIAIAILTVLNHRNFAGEARKIRTRICTQVAREVAKTPEVRDKVIAAVQAIPAHNHQIGKDAPLSEKNNLDTPYLKATYNELKNTEKGNAVFQEFRTLYNQMMLAVTMRHLLPPGMLGLFCLLMILAMISTDDSRIYSAAATITQDIILPLRKKNFTLNEHMWVIRYVSIGIGIFFFFGSYFMSQLDYIQLFVNLMTIMWVGGAGPIMMFGIYSRFGNTWGAWASLLTGMAMGLASVLLQRNWASAIYPWLEKMGWVESIGNFLTTVSTPLNPYIVWEMNPIKCPINSYELSFITTLTTLFLYCTVSWLTGIGKEKFNLERMLHRGIYAIDGEKNIKTDWSFRGIISKLVGITPEYTTGDKCIAWGLFTYSIIYKFLICFVLVVVLNLFSPWGDKAWSNYFLIISLVVPGIVAAVTTVWFGIGGIRDMIQLFKDLKARETVNALDDGRVDGHMSLADKSQLEEIDRQQAQRQQDQDRK